MKNSGAKRLMNNSLERAWEVLFRQLSGVAEETHKLKSR